MFMQRWWPVVLVVAGCIDQPVRIIARDGTAADRLSELGLFEGNPAAQLPGDGVVPYDVIAPLWSDGASKQRFVIAPAPLATSDDRWTIGPGTYLVKTFSYGGRLVETRVIAFATSGVSAATYVWNDEQTEAYASGGNLDIAVAWTDGDGDHRQDHHVPGTSQCDSCHRGGALGIRTP